MEPVYFPFTYVSPSAAALLGVCFRRTAVYQPLSETVPDGLRDDAGSGRFGIRIPVDTDSDRLLKLLAEYQTWASLHGAKNLRFFKTQGGRVPFFDDDTAQYLSTDIRKRAAGKAGDEAPEPLFDARVFLAVAQEFDSRLGEVHNGLSAYREMERKFLKDLKGEPEIPDIGLGGAPALHTEDPGGHTTEARLSAFARLAREDAADDRLFVTTSRAVFDAVTEIIAPAETVLRIQGMPVPGADALPAFQAELADHLRQLLNDPTDEAEEVAFQAAGDTGGPRCSLTLVRAPMGRADFLDACMAPSEAPTPKPPASDAEAILVGLLEGAA